jgi:hypothetical protein
MIAANHEEEVIVPYGLPPIPQNARSDRADLLDKIKPELIVELIRHKLLGEDLVDGVWRPNPGLRQLALSEVGAWQVSNLMLGTASINTSISKLKDVEIKKRLLSIAKTAQYMCIAKFKLYNIMSTDQLHFVHEIVFTNTLVVLKQADEASIQELLKGTVQENRNINTDARKEPGLIRRFIG